MFFENVGWHAHQDLGQATEISISASVPAHLLISNRHNGKFMRRQVVSWASLVKWNSPANWAGSPQLNRPLYVTHPRFQTSLQGCPLLLCSQKVQFLATWMHLWWDLPDGMSETPFCYTLFPKYDFFISFKTLIGQETTSNQLSFTLYEILKQPVIEERYVA